MSDGRRGAKSGPMIRWRWSRPVDSDRITGALDSFAAAGFGPLGIEIDWGRAKDLSEDIWWSALRELHEGAAKTGATFWLHDADPGDRSGLRRGGAPMPDGHRQCVLRVREQAADLTLPEGDIRRDTLAFLLRRDGPILHESIFVPVGGRRTLAGPGTTVILIDQVTCPDLPRSGDAAYLDLLSPEAVGTWVEDRYEKGAVRIRDQRAWAGLRLNAPTYHLGDLSTVFSAGLPWVSGLAEIVRLRHGIDLLARLPELIYRRQNGRHQEVRWAYRETLATYFVQNFTGRLSRWCDRHGLELGGPIGSDNDLVSQARSIGAAMRHHEVMHEPAVRTRAGEGPLALLQAASVARATGRSARADIGEGCGWATSLAELRRLAESAMVLGVDRPSIGPVPSSLRGRALREKPCPLTPAAPGWRHLHYLADHLARLQALFEEMEPTAEVAILHPIESVWAVASPVDSACATALDADFEAVIHAALAAHVQIDLIDEDQLARIGVVAREEGAALLRIGARDCKLLLIPPVLRLRATTLAMIERFLDLRGKVIVIRPGRSPIATPDADTAALLGDQRITPLTCVEIEEILPKRLVDLPSGLCRVHGARDAGAAPVWLRRGRIGARSVAFVVSRTVERSLDLRIDAEEEMRIWDLSSGARSLLPRDETGFSLRLPPGGSALLVGADDDADVPPSGDLAAQVKADLIALRGAIVREVELPEPNGIDLVGATAIPLTTVRWKLDRAAHGSLPSAVPGEGGPHAERTFSEPCELYEAARAIRLLVERPWARSDEECCVLETRFVMTMPPTEAIALVLENSEAAHLVVNGAPLDQASRCAAKGAKRAEEPGPISASDLGVSRAIELGRWLDPALEAFDLSPLLRIGENTIAVERDLHSPLELEPMILLGELSVEGKGQKVGPRPDVVTLADLRTQGLAHHAGEIVYTWHFEAPIVAGDERAILALAPDGEPPGGVSFEVSLDDEFVGAAPWRNHWVNLGSRLSSAGSRTLRVRVLGHLGNVFEPSSNAPLGLLCSPRLLVSRA